MKRLIMIPIALMLVGTVACSSAPIIAPTAAPTVAPTPTKSASDIAEAQEAEIKAKALERANLLCTAVTKSDQFEYYMRGARTTYDAFRVYILEQCMHQGCANLAVPTWDEMANQSKLGPSARVDSDETQE